MPRLRNQDGIEKGISRFNSNYQQVFQYPLQYIPIDPINVCAVILDSLSFSTPARAHTYTLSTSLSLSASRSLSSLSLRPRATLSPLLIFIHVILVSLTHRCARVHERTYSHTMANTNANIRTKVCAFVSAETAHSFTRFVIPCKKDFAAPCAGILLPRCTSGIYNVVRMLLLTRR